MINLNLISVFYIILICYIPISLRIYAESYINNFWIGLIANIISLILICSTYLILNNSVKKDKSNERNLSILFFSIFSIILVLYITVIIFSQNVVFVGGKYFTYVVYSYLIYSYLFIQFLAIFAFRFYHQIKKEI
jgi:hypothetical protein